MKTYHLQKLAAALALAGLACSTHAVLAQDSNVPGTVPPAAASAPAPQLAYGVSQVLQLAQAKLNDDTIIAYIKNSGNSYGLSADQIIYLHQQGVSSAVISTMLNQPRAGVMADTSSTMAPQPEATTAYAGQALPTTPAPPVTYVQTVPDTTYYYDQPYYYSPYYYPAYAWYPPVTFSVGWGGRFGGGWRGGGFGGGGFVGGFHGGFHSVGGFHGGHR
jgi:hypothetical protein